MLAGRDVEYGSYVVPLTAVLLVMISVPLVLQLGVGPETLFWAGSAALFALALIGYAVYTLLGWMELGPDPERIDHLRRR